MKLFRKQAPGPWWALNHPKDPLLLQVEKALHGSGLVYQYDYFNEAFYLALQLMDQESHPLCFIIRRKSSTKISVTSCSNFPASHPEEREGITQTLKDVNQKSDFVDFQVNRSGMIIGEYTLKASRDGDWARFIVPIMLEHARMVNNNFKNIKAAYQKANYRYILGFDAFFQSHVAQDLSLNKIYHINGETAIAHQPHIYNHIF